MLTYSPRARRAYAYLYRKYNDIDVYVEDVTSIGVYEIILGRLLRGYGKVTRVLQMGGRSAVLEEARRLRGDYTRKRLFLLDADFDVLMGRREKLGKNIYVLNAYCLENLVLSLAAVRSVARESDSDSAASILEHKLDLPGLIQQIRRLLVPLFILYSIAERAGAGIATVGYTVHRLLGDDGHGALCRAKVRRRYREIIVNVVDKQGMECYVSTKLAVRARLRSSDSPIEWCVSGKDYILPMILKRLHSRAGFRGNSRQLVAQLAGRCDLGPWLPLRRRLVRRIKGM